MMTDNEFVLVAYAVTAVALVALVAWILLDQRARRNELAELESMGIRRRSASEKSRRAERTS